MRIMMSAVLVAISLACAGEAAAECVCRCIDGELGAICLGSTVVPPVCAPRVYPTAPQFTPPHIAQTAPPAGTTQCRMAQVLNAQTGRYEWMELCR
jgi:hypothetical protein